jgi:hypothetical protein
MADTSSYKILAVSPGVTTGAPASTSLRRRPEADQKLSHDLLTSGPAAWPPTDSPLRHPLPSCGGRGARALGEWAPWVTAVPAPARVVSRRVWVTA